MDNITLTLTLDEVNTVLGALGGEPYQRVFGLVNKITEQATEQLKEVSGGDAAE